MTCWLFTGYESNSEDKHLTCISSGRSGNAVISNCDWSSAIGKDGKLGRLNELYTMLIPRQPFKYTSGDIEVNAGPKAITNDTAPTTTQKRRRASPRCIECKKSVAKNQKPY